MDANLLSTSEAAKRLGVSMRRVQQLAERGELASVQLGHYLYFREPDVNEFRRKKSPGRPPKKKKAS